MGAATLKPSVKCAVRIAFWIVFLAAAGFAAHRIWTRLDPLHNHPVIAPWWLSRLHTRVSSPNPATAARAWTELELCFLRKWSAYDWVVWRVKEDIWKPVDPPIHFGLHRSGNRFYARPGPPSTECRTVNEALMAILYQEPTWKTAHQGDWRKWWDANWTYFPNHYLAGKPSGPEDPNSRRRR